MYVIGGRSGGRYLNDCWVFNLKTKTWTEKKWKEVDQSNKMAFLPALASASYLHSSGLKCIVVGGHTKPDHRTPDMKVRIWHLTFSFLLNDSSIPINVLLAFVHHLSEFRISHFFSLSF